jgi:hypothetical protein
VGFWYDTVVIVVVFLFVCVIVAVAVAVAIAIDFDLNLQFPSVTKIYYIKLFNFISFSFHILFNKFTIAVYSFQLDAECIDY